MTTNDISDVVHRSLGQGGPRLLLPELVVVTGASGGLGAACAGQLLDSGCVVVGVDVHGSGPSSGKQYHHVQADTRLDDDWTRVAQVVEDLNPTTIGLVSAAAVLQVGTVLDSPIEEWRRSYDINVLGTVQSMRAVIPLMLARGGGSIVAVASVSALGAEQGLAAYCSSKAAVWQLARATAVDFAHNNIRVNVVSPGPMETGLFEIGIAESPKPDDARAARRLRQPNGRLTEPRETCAGITFLLSDAASAITGTELRIDGGLTTGFEFRQPSEVPSMHADHS